MATYRVLEKCYLESSTTGLRIYQPGEVIEYDGAAPEYLKPVGAGPHDVALRKFDIVGGENLHRHKRAEIVATAAPTRVGWKP